MTDAILRWGAILLFSILVSSAFIFYGMVFNDIGSPPNGTVALISYFLKTILHPLFIGGMVLALSGALVRMFLFGYVGIAETAMVSELTLVMTVILAVVIFDTTPSRKEYMGMALIMIGVYFVQSGGGAT